MPTATELRTPRLRLRGWEHGDREPFAALNADAMVMEHFPGLLSRADSDAFVDRITADLDQRGWGLWATELTASSTFVGYVGLTPVPFAAPFTPAIEIGWRLAAAYWGQGLATEAARAVVAHGFGTLGLGQIVSFTAAGNVRSRRVMEKVGMRHDRGDDFDHPRLPPGHRLRRHVLYRLDQPR